MNRLLGAHVSISGSFDQCIDRIHHLGGNTLMTFASSPRSMKTKEFSPEVISKYKQKKAELSIGPHFFHGIYLINLATKSKDLLKASQDSLIFYQRFAYQIGAVGTIFHIGSHQGRTIRDVFNQVVSSVNFILDSSPKGTKLILENAAGHGGTIGADFEELSEIISRVGDKSKIGVCLDTQHAFASGYDLDTLLDRFHKDVGIKHLKVIHLNDSKTDFNSHVDRHENLGKGKIGRETLKQFVNDERLKKIPIILEVPGLDSSGPRKVDLNTLKSFFD